MIRRIFIEGSVQSGETITVSGEDGHHLARVLRVQAGETLSVAAANGAYAATVAEVGKSDVTLRLGGPLSKRDPEVSVYFIQALAKGDKMETVIQKGTEAGAAGFVLVQTERSVVQLQANKVEERLVRWRKVAREAASQSQRDAIPGVDFVSRLEQLSAWVETHQGVRLMVLDEQEQTLGLKSVLAAARASGVTKFAVAIGPEGGWSDADRSFWQRLGADSLTLGPRILRTETAGLVAASAILYEFNELGG